MPKSLLPSLSVVRYVALLLCLIVTIDGECYFPSKDLAPSHTPCDATASVSHCCDQESVCLDNGYCMNQFSYGNRIGRGACTDPTFANAACPQYCKDEVPTAGVSVFPVLDSDPGMFCCGPGNSSQCTYPTNNSQKPFPLANGAIIYNRTSGSTGPNNTVVMAVSTVTVTSSATAPAETINATNNAVAIGAGVGVPLGVVLLLALALLWIQTSRVRKLKRELRMVTTDSNPMLNQKYSSVQPAQEVPNRAVHELSENRPMAELRA